MRRALIAILLTVCSVLAFGQTTVGAGAKPISIAPSSIMAPGKIYVNLATMTHPRIGSSQNTVKITCTESSSSSTDCNTSTQRPPNMATIGSGGDFRLLCRFSHAAFDDPIVFPGRPGMTHLHQFFGNTKTGSASDLFNMANNGSSTCDGGTLNRTGYWTPPLIYECPPGSTNGCDVNRNGNITFGYVNNAYYKASSAYAPADLAALQWFPVGLRMIAGNATSTAVLDPNIAKFACNGSAGSTYLGPTGQGEGIPTKAQVVAWAAAHGISEADALGTCNDLNMMVMFPQCWDGVNLDSPNHASHMHYSDFYHGCHVGSTDSVLASGAYPVLMPSITFNVHFTITDLNDFDFIRLSSDQPRATATGACATAVHNYCAGATAHGDWVGGWSAATNYIAGTGAVLSITDAIIKNCLKIDSATGYAHDCHDDLVGPADPANPLRYYTLSQ